MILLVGSFPNRMFVTNIDPGEIINIVDMLKSNSSKGNDDSEYHQQHNL